MRVLLCVLSLTRSGVVARIYQAQNIFRLLLILLQEISVCIPTLEHGNEGNQWWARLGLNQ